MSKGYAKHAKESKDKFDIVKEFNSIQKAAYEAKYASEQIEKMYNGLSDMTSSLNDITCGLVELLIKKELIDQKELDQAISSYVERKTKEVLDIKMTQLGYIEEVDKVELNCLAYVDLSVTKGEELLKGYPRKMFLIPGSTYLFPGLEGMILDMKVGEDKSFDLSMPEDFKIVDLRKESLSFKVSIIAIKKKVNIEELVSEN